ncbi:acyltransferase family protein [Rarobacter faecitabidus]|uniref:Peptidoglycan/LPS O-acetylase OafA/YrhL n=1 Tax=Rarobacter faecitabidus TaxID=13243 RepID=A0A542ZUY0_RARFA|nr:acyltransferase family protein [Rarobacter faecitabidus]TQL64168.1 peptidoglycan/LPS O-acetylase OafA/YrhL [Rarobacter faecitabidus]
MAKQQRVSPDVFATRIAGLDALRALAVVLVFVYHLAPQTFPGGFLGVDVFFVVSGFLITGLLIRRWRTERSFEVVDFWRRRARRLLPALFAVVGLATAVAGAVGDDILVGIRTQVLGAVTFTSNWLYIAAGSSYASGLHPDLFTHLWSLAVEEQFYLIWPLALALLLAFAPRLARRRGWGRLIPARPMAVILALCLALGAASAISMAVMAQPDGDPSRVYYGTDTHLIGLMLGGALAAAVSSGAGARFLGRVRGTRGARLAGVLMLAVGVCIVCALAATLQWNAAATYDYGITAASAATAVILLGILCIPGAAQRAERGGLAWVGTRSYGLYLFHWPVIVVLYYAAPNLSSWLRMPIVIAVTVTLAGLSYRYLEQPVRRLGFRMTARGALRALGPAAPARMRATVATGALVALIAVAGTAHAVVRPAQTTALDRQLSAGAELLAELDESADLELLSDDDMDDSSEPETVPAQPVVPDQPAEPAGPGADAAKLTAPNPSGANVTIIGDSVTIASAKSIAKELPKVAVSAAVGRSLADAIEIVPKLRKRNKLRPYLVLALGTNSTVDSRQLSKLMAEIGPDHAVVLVTGHADRSWIKPTNKVLRAAPKKYPNVVVADWDKVAAKNTKIFGADGIHPKPARTGVYAKAIVAALQEAQRVFPVAGGK